MEINLKTKLVWRLAKREDQALISISTILISFQLRIYYFLTYKSNQTSRAVILRYTGEYQFNEIERRLKS